MAMKKIILAGIFGYLLLFSGFPANAETWSLSYDEYWTKVETLGMAKIDNLSVNAFLRLNCNKNGAMLKLEIADFDKVQKLFDVRIFEGPSAPTRDLLLTTIDLEGMKHTWSSSFKQAGYISVENRFVFEVRNASLAKLYKRMATKGNLLRIRIKSYRDPKQSIISEFKLGLLEQMFFNTLAAACVNFTPALPKPPKGK
jgi:hypothetical protein